jgi:hypothetical protein
VRRVANERLKTASDDSTALRALVAAAEAAQQWDEVKALSPRLIAAARANASDFNRVAWDTLFYRSADDKTLDAAKRAVELTQRQVRPLLHTLATIYAEIGRPVDAREILLEAVELSGGELDPEDDYILGRIAEDYGMTATAVGHYRKVPLPSNLRTATYTLAQRRISALVASSAH